MNNKDQKVEKVCYVCGLELDEFPYDPEVFTSNHSVICPACGIHYGYDDGGAGDVIPDELAYSDWKFGDENHIKIIKFWRDKWIKEGMKWKHQDIPSLTFMPHNWNQKNNFKIFPKNSNSHPILYLAAIMSQQPLGNKKWY